MIGHCLSRRREAHGFGFPETCRPRLSTRSSPALFEVMFGHSNIVLLIDEE